ncbi:aspartate-semialdehyde dehydrogenase [Candidatus Parcubacteria bacterium]|nr:aspartate-semialdehyde dehydrogenase [Candidatus Parcubacteria bacterium]
MLKQKIGIFGATGIVGREILKVLFDKKFPIESLSLYASEKSTGKKIKTPLGEIIIQDANRANYSKLNIAFFAIGGEWPKKNSKKAISAGCIVIDNSSTFRYDKNVPLIIPEINPNEIKNSLLIANPNCTTAIAAIPLWQIYKNFGLKKIIISTYQAASGAGAQGMKELKIETKKFLKGEKTANKIFQHPLAFNLIPHIDAFQKNGYTKEEMKVVWETKKIFNDENIKISCSCVRVPIVRAHSENILVETKKEIGVLKIKNIFKNTDGIEVRDDIENCVYPMPITASRKYDIEVGRIRNSLIFGKNGLEFFVCGDQILKGAALNAVQIAELVVNKE